MSDDRLEVSLEKVDQSFLSKYAYTAHRTGIVPTADGALIRTTGGELKATLGDTVVTLPSGDRCVVAAGQVYHTATSRPFDIDGHIQDIITDLDKRPKWVTEEMIRTLVRKL